MRVLLDPHLFTLEHAQDALLLQIFAEGRDGRYGVQVKGWRQPVTMDLLESWMERQSRNAQETATLGLRRGERWKRYSLPDGRQEPKVILEPNAQPVWPRSFDDGPARLPLDRHAMQLLCRPLALFFENDRNDWRFLCKIVPSWFEERWRRAIDNDWIQERMGGGLGEMRKKVEENIAPVDRRRLRAWILFDSDAREPDAPSEQARQMASVCDDVGIPYHMLERRMIENYIPVPVLKAWAEAGYSRTVDTTKSPKKQGDAHALRAELRKVCELPAACRHHLALKPFGDRGKKLHFGDLVDIWRTDDHAVTQTQIDNDGWANEQQLLFESLRASL